MPHRALGIYVHWPYCAQICPYCDFNVYRTRNVDATRWADALRADLRDWAGRINPRPLRSLYFGGGTPSEAPLSVIASVVETCGALFGFEADAEITLEANPTSADKARFSDFKAAGVNRLSLGVQSLRDEALRFLGRRHTAKEARAALALALDLFPKSSFDLIYARPGQTTIEWREELREAVDLGPAHLSCYQLTVEPGTAFERAVFRGAWAPLDEDLEADLFDLTQDLTEAAGLAAYEISNHARPGAQSQHNLLYWRQEDYIGVGPGAHGRVMIGGDYIASETVKRPGDYLAAGDDGSSAFNTLSVLDNEARLAECLLMGLRLTQGVPITPLLADMLAARADALSDLTNEGFVHISPQRIRATQKGRKVLNAIVHQLLA